MLVIKTLGDLKKHLEKRREMVKNEKVYPSSVSEAKANYAHKNGMVHAFDEALEAIQSLFNEMERAYEQSVSHSPKVVSPTQQ